MNKKEEWEQQQTQIKMDKEIKYNLINSAIAGGLVFLGSLTPIFASEFSWFNLSIGVGSGLVIGLIVFLNKFKDYWDSEKDEYCTTTKIFNFL